MCLNINSMPFHASQVVIESPWSHLLQMVSFWMVKSRNQIIITRLDFEWGLRGIGIAICKYLLIMALHRTTLEVQMPQIEQTQIMYDRYTPGKIHNITYTNHPQEHVTCLKIYCESWRQTFCISFIIPLQHRKNSRNVWNAKQYISRWQFYEVCLCHIALHDNQTIAKWTWYSQDL